MLSLKESIESRGSFYKSNKCMIVMRGMFDYAIDRGWMHPPNPAMGSKQSKSKHKPTPNPSLSKAVAQFEDWSARTRRSGGDPAAVKVLVMTSRGGSPLRSMGRSST